MNQLSPPHEDGHDAIRSIRIIILIPFCIIFSLILLNWAANSFLNYIPGSFEKSFGFQEPKHRAFLKEDIFAPCSFSVFNPCNLEYRYTNIDEAEFEEISVRMKAVGFPDWEHAGKYDCEGRMGNYGCGRNGADLPYEERYVTSKDPTGTSWRGLYYYPSNKTLDAVLFDH